MSQHQTGQLTIDDLHELDPEPDTNPTSTEPATNTREYDVLEDGARYRHHPSETHQTRDLTYPDDHCQYCGTQLPRSFRRVFGDNDDIAWRCIHCPDTNRDGLTNSANTANQNRDVRSARHGGDPL